MPASRLGIGAVLAARTSSTSTRDRRAPIAWRRWCATSSPTRCTSTASSRAPSASIRCCCGGSGASPARPSWLAPAAVSLNSFFARAFSINPVLLRRLGRIPSLPIVLAPRGEFSPGALQIKPRRKRAWLAVSRVLGLHRDLIWQASSPLEAADIRRCLGPIERDRRSRIVVAPIIASADPPAAPGAHVHPLARRSKPPGHLRVVFLSRLSPKKNLLGALRILGTVRGSVEFNIYGPVGDERYWR